MSPSIEAWWGVTGKSGERKEPTQGASIAAVPRSRGGSTKRSADSGSRPTDYNEPILRPAI
ncbi:hypothetical protein [Botrimarina hoheduenensis]|uniref:hypothetical protein n=1 Tax=Botrimarina hoheduenensis TaxID=2528000 RepID=UPI0011B6EE03|nr:hypothetical protein [Botrimarina hoheduenensis]